MSGVLLRFNKSIGPPSPTHENLKEKARPTPNARKEKAPPERVHAQALRSKRGGDDSTPRCNAEEEVSRSSVSDARACRSRARRAVTVRRPSKNGHTGGSQANVWAGGEPNQAALASPAAAPQPLGSHWNACTAERRKGGSSHGNRRASPQEAPEAKENPGLKSPPHWTIPCRRGTRQGRVAT